MALADMSTESRSAIRPAGAITRRKLFHGGKVKAPMIPLTSEVMSSSQKLM